MFNNDLPLELQLLIARSSLDSTLRKRLLEHPEQTMRINGVELDDLSTIKFVDSHEETSESNDEVFIIALPELEQTKPITNDIKKVGKISNNKLASSGYNVATVHTNVDVATNAVEAAEVNTTAVAQAEVAATEAEAVATTTTEATETETTAAVVAEVVLVAT